MLQFILSLFGCGKSPSTTITSSELGPFTIETITKTGKTYNINYGRVGYTNISYDVKYKGVPITFEGGLESNTGLPGIWRIFTLHNTPQPTLLLGSQSLYLVTIENDKPVIKPVFQQGYDFASVQWLDSEAGQPGEYREIFSSDDFDVDTDLSGGRYMAISHAVVLDTKTLEIYPYNTNNEDIEGFSKAGSNVVAFSPDSTQLIYRGAKVSETTYEYDQWALLSYNFRTGKTYAVPFKKTECHLQNESRMNAIWLADYFEWIKQGDGQLKLTQKLPDSTVFRKGDFMYERNRGYSYSLDPVRESMRDHLSAFIREELKIDTSQFYKIDGDFYNREYFKFNDIVFMMTYGEYVNELVLQPESSSHYGEHKDTITRIASGFNALLNSGKFQDQWLPIDTPRQLDTPSQ